MFRYIGSPSPNEERNSHRFMPGQSKPARADAALPRRCGGASALAHSLAHSLRQAAMRSAAAGLIVAALTVPGAAQTEGLKKGFYVIDQYPCANAPGVGVLSFDGESFLQKSIACTLMATPNAAGVFQARCVEGNDDTAAEEMTWKFKILSSTSFRINDNTYRLCRKWYRRPRKG